MIIQGVTLNGTRVVDGSIITQNLALYYDANSSTSYPGTGTSIYDLSGNSRTQTLQNAAQYTTLNGVKCFDCSTGTYYVTANSAGLALPTTGFTYIAWARMISSSAGWRTLFRTTPDDHPILVELGSNRLGMYDNNGGNFISCGYDVSSIANTWVQWCTTGNSSGQTFYINGQQVGTTAYSASGNSHYWTSLSGQPFGYIANLFLYTSILTPEQIQQNYYGLRSRFGTLSFTSVGSTTWVAPPNVTTVSYLVVGGGGGGGNAYDNSGGGGGGGGMVLSGSLSVTPGQSYTVTVGDGGAGGSGSYPGTYNGTAGSSSVFSSVTALGGGAGWGCRQSTATLGAAQVGSTTSATGGGGGGGGAGGNGGGGAGGSGGSRSGTTGGSGGSGTSNSITGSSVTYGAGGKAGNSGSQNSGGAGTSNTGNGGQGGGATSGNFTNGGKGGSGIVVLSYY